MPAPRCYICSHEIEELYECRRCNSVFCEDCGSIEDRLCLYCMILLQSEVKVGEEDERDRDWDEDELEDEWEEEYIEVYEYEEDAIELYRKIIKKAWDESDQTTNKLFRQILADEEDHHDTFVSLLEEI